MRGQKETIAIFAGTTEGRQLCEYLVKQQREIVGFVATEYGRALLDEETKKRVRVGRLTETEMEQVLKTESPSPRCRCHASLCNGSNPKYSNCVYKAEFAVFTFKEKGNKAGAR